MVLLYGGINWELYLMKLRTGKISDRNISFPTIKRHLVLQLRNSKNRLFYMTLNDYSIAKVFFKHNKLDALEKRLNLNHIKLD